MEHNSDHIEGKMLVVGPKASPSGQLLGIFRMAAIGNYLQYLLYALMALSCNAGGRSAVMMVMIGF